MHFRQTQRNIRSSETIQCPSISHFPCRHVIGYLLEHGMFDTNTLFAKEVSQQLSENVQRIVQIDSKPPSFNKTQDVPEEVISRSLPPLRY